MVKKLLSAITSVAILTGATALPVSSMDYEAESILDRMSDTQRNDFETVVTYLGYASAEDFINETLAMRSSVVDSSRIKDLNDDGTANTADAVCLMRFLEGNLQYSHDYRDLDVNGDCLIDKNDPSEYLRYYVHYMNQNVAAPFSAHGIGEVPETASEVRRYIKHTYSSGTAPNSTDVEYCLGASSINSYVEDGLLSVAENLEETYDECYWEYLLDAEDASVLQSSSTTPYTKVQDSRVIRCSGSGAIIGPHTILTNAHCLYSRNDTTGERRYSDSDVCAFTFTDDGEPIRHDLTVISYHIPKDYITNEDNGVYKVRFDYALIVVEEDLSDYGCFDLGYALDEIVDTETSLTVTGFPQAAPCMSPDEGYNYRKYMVSSYGTVIPLTSADQDNPEKADYHLRGTAATTTGSSGSPMYTETALQDTQIGLITGGSHGLRFTRPMLEFFFHNEYLGLEGLS